MTSYRRSWWGVWATSALLMFAGTFPASGDNGNTWDDENDWGSTSTEAAKPETPVLEEVTYPPYHGPKKTMAVLTFENKTKGSYGSWEIGEGLTEMLVTELIKTNHFIVVERQVLQDLLKEQELGQTGLVRQESAARVGNLAGAQFLIKGVVSEFEYKAGGSGFGLNISGFNLGRKTNKAHVGMDVRIIDANTGEIIQSQNVKADADASGFNVGFAKAGEDWGIGTGSFNKTPMGQAARQAIHQAIRFIIDKSERLPWSGAVIKADAGRAFINRGANSNIFPGASLVVYSQGEVLIDPQTGLNLGSEEERIGSLTITTVKDKFSIGNYQPDRGNVQCKRGDVVRLK
ncbi:MAG: hypothetical protein GY731_08795 [Gammaproteobacteria bacterium]|nr:hypothetical protein [Gammaproteobacteria bacterium]